MTAAFLAFVLSQTKTLLSDSCFCSWGLFAALLLLGISPNFGYGQNNETSNPTILTGLYGTIRSGEFPAPYGNDIDETWEIQVREGYRIHLHFTTFDLEDSYEDDVGACAYDYLQVTICKCFSHFVKNEIFHSILPRNLHEYDQSKQNH